MKQVLVKMIPLLTVLVGLSSCLNSNAPEFESFKTAEAPVDVLEGKIDLIDSSELELKGLSTKPLLLIFASETCSVCREESIAFKAEFEKLSQIKILTLLVGSIKEDAEDWSSADNWEDSREIPWTVGYEYEPTLFNKYCPNSSAPCSLLQLPGKGVVLKRVGKLHPSEVLEILNAQN